MNKPTKRQLAHWYRRAKLLDEKSTDGYAMGAFDDRGYTFSGGRDPEPGQPKVRSPHRSLDAIGSSLYLEQQTYGVTEGGSSAKLHDTVTAEFWRIVGHKANNLPERHPHRAFLVEVADTGNLDGTSKALGMPKRKGEWVWRKFLVSVCELPPPKTTVQDRRPGPKACAPMEPDPVEVPAPVKTLSKDQIAQLTYTPPSKKAAQ